MSDISTDAMMREAAMMDASDNHVWARKVRRLCIERDKLKAQIAALPPAPDAVEAIREMTETDHANIIAHLSPELTPTGPLPNRNSLMMEVVRLRNQVKALVDAKAGGVEFDWGADVGREVLPR